MQEIARHKALKRAAAADLEDIAHTFLSRHIAAAKGKRCPVMFLGQLEVRRPASVAEAAKLTVKLKLQHAWLSEMLSYAAPPNDSDPSMDA